MNPRFQRLRDMLDERSSSVVRLSFTQLESLLGHDVPDADDRSPDGGWDYRDLSRTPHGVRWQSKVDYRRREVVFARV